MTRHEVALIDQSPCGDGVATFRFEKPGGYEFIPGQYFVLEVQTAEGPVAKPFSHAAAPLDDWVEITTRVSDSAFKQVLTGMRPGQTVRIGDAAGKLVLPDPTPPVAFLVGGVGITPVRSMVRDAVGRQSGMRAVLIFGNRSEECIPYRAELESYGALGIECVHVLEHAPTGWGGRTGLIDAELVRQTLGDTGIDGRLYVTAGPPGMVAAMERCMDDLGIASDDRLVERFAGY